MILPVSATSDFDGGLFLRHKRTREGLATRSRDRSSHGVVGRIRQPVFDIFAGRGRVPIGLRSESAGRKSHSDGVSTVASKVWRRDSSKAADRQGTPSQTLAGRGKFNRDVCPRRNDCGRSMRCNWRSRWSFTPREVPTILSWLTNPWPKSPVWQGYRSSFRRRDRQQRDGEDGPFECRRPTRRDRGFNVRRLQGTASLPPPRRI
jgi:hypothetical protein